MEQRWRAFSFLLLGLGLLLAACSGGREDDATSPPTKTAPPRSFAMGLSSLPPELTEESYDRAFRLAGETGELILIQRVPPWQELLQGKVSDDTARITQLERELAEEHGLDLFVAIDPTDMAGGRRELADLPADLQGAGFDDERVRQAFLTYAQYVAVNYRPKYLALGVEVNTYYEHQPDEFEHFVSLYEEAYDAVKELTPKTLVFPTFQLEELDGQLAASETQQGKTQWGLIRRFEGRLDVLAVSTYPSLAFDDPVSIPDDYYRKLTKYTDRPIAIAQMGYSSGPGRDGLNDGTEEEQAAFLRQVLADAQELAMPFVVWFAAWDPPLGPEPPFDLLQHLGLLETDGTTKEAWRVWREAAQRPLAERPSARNR